MVGLLYTGRGCGMFVHGVPARDLSAEEVEQHGGERSLLKSGCYERARKTPVKKQAAEE